MKLEQKFIKNVLKTRLNCQNKKKIRVNIQQHNIYKFKVIKIMLFEYPKSGGVLNFKRYY